MDSSGSESSQVTGFSEHGDQPSVSLNDGELFDWLSNRGLLQKDPAVSGR
jgi:hypothetical protein